MLAALGVQVIQSPPSGAVTPREVDRPTRAENVLLSPRRKALEKPDALSGHQRLIRQRGVTPLMYQYGET